MPPILPNPIANVDPELDAVLNEIRKVMPDADLRPGTVLRTVASTVVQSLQHRRGPLPVLPQIDPAAFILRPESYVADQIMPMTFSNPAARASVNAAAQAAEDRNIYEILDDIAALERYPGDLVGEMRQRAIHAIQDHEEREVARAMFPDRPNDDYEMYRTEINGQFYDPPPEPRRERAFGPSILAEISRAQAQNPGRPWEMVEDLGMVVVNPDTRRTLERHIADPVFPFETNPQVRIDDMRRPWGHSWEPKPEPPHTMTLEEMERIGRVIPPTIWQRLEVELMLDGKPRQIKAPGTIARILTEELLEDLEYAR